MRGVRDPESVAAHAWGTALLCVLFADEAGVPRGEAVEIAVAHDLAEADIGDVASLADPSLRTVSEAEKTRLEAAAMADLTARWPGAAAERIAARWQAYENRDSATALFVRDMNLIDMCLQAYLYERDLRYRPDPESPLFAGATPEGRDGLREFFASADVRLSTPVGRELFASLREAYRALAEGVDG